MPPVIAFIALWTTPEPPAAIASLISRSTWAERSDKLGQARVGKAHRLQPPHRRAHPAAARSSRTSSSAATISCNRSRNHGSKPAIAWIRSTVKPSRSASAATSSRSGVGLRQRASICRRDPHLQARAPGRGRTARSPARAAPSAGFRRSCGRSPSLRRPTSSRSTASASAPLNFSNAKRGILVTT